MTKIEVVYERLLPELAKHNIEDTPENRLAALEGLLDGWTEDTDAVDVEKTKYMIAVRTEITFLKMRLMLARR